jgi:HK97 family phage portal protein
MAWNAPSSKSLQNAAIQQDGISVKAGVGVGAPVALQPGLVGRGYKDSWDIERAYREGMQKATWVFRCIDAIAGNQARLPMILRKDNSPDGEVIKKKNNELLTILNSKSNEGENSFIFRYRMSAQLLMSTRGVFIEKIVGRDGSIKALQLLPPQHTAPIPDARNFVAGYEIEVPGMIKKVLAPDKVLWIRRPHPLNPYLSLTPMEAAGVAIEIENLAKIYNRNFLLNDGRPGGLLVVRGEMDEDDKDELRSRFRGNLNRTGATSVISADDGVDFVDTASSPRDAAYTEMRQITKEEILAAFGVPESVIGNASGRTFSNASEELRVFWMETMLPHLEPLARAMDELDDKYYVDFDTSEVPIMIIAHQERMRYLKDEFSQGLISVNEYREGRGMKTVKSDLADSLLANPNLTPIANTEKPFDPNAQAGGAPGMPPGAPGVPGMPPGAPGVPGMPPGAPGEVPGMPGATPPDGGGAYSQLEAEGAPPAEGAAPGMGGQVEDPAAQFAAQAAAAPEPEIDMIEDPAQQFAEQADGQASAPVNELNFKSLEDDWDIKAAQTSDRWGQIMEHSLNRFFERQQRVVTEKALGAKSRSALEKGDLKIETIFDDVVWDKQLDDDIRPVISAMIQEGAESTKINFKEDDGITDAEIDELIEQHLGRIKKINKTTKREIAAAIIASSAMREDRYGTFKAALTAIFAGALGSRSQEIAEQEAQSAINGGVFLAAMRGGKGNKQWVSRRDSKVRSAHKQLDGNRVKIDQPFSVDGIPIRFPGDPVAPANLTLGCRCRLRFQP